MPDRKVLKMLVASLDCDKSFLFSQSLSVSQIQSRIHDGMIEHRCFHDQ